MFQDLDGKDGGYDDDKTQEEEDDYDDDDEYINVIHDAAPGSNSKAKNNKK